MKKYKVKKSIKIIVILLFITIIALLLITSIKKTKSYSLEYSIDNYDISENFDNKTNIYYYQITDGKQKYDFIYESPYIENKKLISKINKHTSKEYTCITIESSSIKSYPICNNGKQNVDYHLVDDKLKDELQEYYKEQSEKKEKIDNYVIYNNEKMFIWNYKGFNYINDNKITKINIFKKDIYDIPLATKINEYILLPDYEQNYNFNKFYIINTKTLEVDEWEINYDISFNSYINGINYKSIYLTDIKNEKQYEIVPHKKRMRIVGNKYKDGIQYVHGKEEKIPMSELINKKIYFISNNPYVYKVENKELYLNYLENQINTKITNTKIDKIVSDKKDEVYYMKEDTLYKYSLKTGEIKLIKYEEWSYNKTNSIFINN